MSSFILPKVSQSLSSQGYELNTSLAARRRLIETDQLSLHFLLSFFATEVEPMYNTVEVTSVQGSDSQSFLIILYLYSI